MCLSPICLLSRLTPFSNTVSQVPHATFLFFWVCFTLLLLLVKYCGTIIRNKEYLTSKKCSQINLSSFRLAVSIFAQLIQSHIPKPKLCFIFVPCPPQLIHTPAFLIPLTPPKKWSEIRSNLRIGMLGITGYVNSNWPQVIADFLQKCQIHWRWFLFVAVSNKCLFFGFKQ
jgi:hypothetical protein